MTVRPYGARLFGPLTTQIPEPGSVSWWPSWGRLALLGLIGTLVGQRFANATVATAFLALAAGSVLHVVIELLAVARRTGFKELTTWCILTGLVLGFLITDGILVAAGA